MIMAERKAKGRDCTVSEFRAQIVEMHSLGFSRRQICKKLSASLITVRRVFNELGPAKKKKVSVFKYHDWLDANDEANVLRFWVPTPEEIAKQCEALQARWTDAERQARNMYK